MTISSGIRGCFHLKDCNRKNKPKMFFLMVLVIMVFIIGNSRLLNAEFFPVDISKVCNMGFRDEKADDKQGGWTDQGENDLRELPVGKQIFQGIPFTIIDPAKNDNKSCIVLFGQMGPYFPEKVEIPVNRKGKTLCFLQTGAWTEKSEYPIGKYELTYIGGKKVTVALRGGYELSDWWGIEETQNSSVAWKGNNPTKKGVGVSLMEWSNPYPEEIIEKIIFQSFGTKTVPILLGITLSTEFPQHITKVQNKKIFLREPVGKAPDWCIGWGTPKVEVNKGFKNIRCGSKVIYDFQVLPDCNYIVVLGFSERHCSEAGQRVMDIIIEGEKKATIDPVADYGQNVPFTIAFMATDKDKDGYLNVECRESEKAKDPNAFINVIWVFNAEGIKIEQVKEEAMYDNLSVEPLYYVDCGNEGEEVIHQVKQSVAQKGKETTAPAPALHLREPFHFKVTIPEWFNYPYKEYVDFIEKREWLPRDPIFGNLVCIFPTWSEFLGYKHGATFYPDSLNKNSILDISNSLTLYFYNKDKKPLSPKLESSEWYPNFGTQFFTTEEGIKVTAFHSIVNDVIISRLELQNTASQKQEVNIEVRGILPTSVEEIKTQAVFEKEILIFKGLEHPYMGICFAFYCDWNKNWNVLPDENAVKYYSPPDNLSLKPNEKKIVQILMTVGYDQKDVLNRIGQAKSNLQEFISKDRKELNDYFNYVVPRFECSEKRYETLYYWTYMVQKANLIDEYTGVYNGPGQPATPPKKGNWMLAPWWDNAFGSITQKWLNDTTLSKNTLFFGTIGSTSDIGAVGLPVFAVGVWDYYLRTGDKNFLQESLEKMKIWENSCCQKGQKNVDGDLFQNYLNSLVWDVSVRWNGYYTKEPRQLYTPFTTPLELIDASSLRCYHQQIMSKIYEELNNKEEAQKWKEMANKTAAEINRLMWDEEEGFYFDIREKDKGKLTCKSNGAFVSLLAGIPNEKQKQKLLEHLNNPEEFKTTLRIPTISKDWPGYTTNGYWDGQVWPPMNWLIIEGLIYYGEIDLAREIIQEWLPYATADTKWCNREYYNQETGQGMGATMVSSFGGLTTDFLIRRVMGVSPSQGDTIEFWPFALDRNWDYALFGNFQYKGMVIDVIWDKPGDGVDYQKDGLEGYTVKIDGRPVYTAKSPGHILVKKEGNNYKVQTVKN